MLPNQIAVAALGAAATRSHAPFLLLFLFFFSTKKLFSFDSLIIDSERNQRITDFPKKGDRLESRRPAAGLALSIDTIYRYLNRDTSLIIDS